MTYLALARKWRPRTFEDVVGQPHIVRALTNALTSGRIHHAFLFAGTRGVGKTTVARIFARCLNCEQGISATPCGKCSACVAIEEGRFVDLIEVDAASRTKVDETRELLDNVQYTPSGGRFKVYLIDEVHMLSNHAFNALLKTLEEPPPHVKFLFATTDPQKLPVTVLSRCLQFNLKRLPTALVVERMARICEAEGAKVEPGALLRLARAGAGSMRDSLSLLDQALAYGNQALRDEDVAEMLGTMDRGRILKLVDALAAGDAAALLARVRDLDEMVPDYASVLDDLATVLQRIAVIQIAGAEALEDEDDIETLRGLATRFAPETTQLHYQIAVIGRRELADSPDPRTGFEMSMLRMLAFRPGSVVLAAPATSPPAVVSAGPGRASAAAPTDEPTGADTGDWASFVQGLNLDGAARQLAMHTELVSITPFEVRLRVDQVNAQLVTDQQRARLTQAIQARHGDQVRVRIDVQDRTGDTPAARQAQRQGEAMARAREAIESDPNVRDLTDLFGAELVPGSVKPMTPESGKRGQ
jgi:DNA polymerase-3 subunit gamma/tau